MRKSWLRAYTCSHFTRRDRLNTLLKIASGRKIDHVVQVNQDTNIYVSEIEAGRQVSSDLQPGHCLYLVCLEGSLEINGLSLNQGDAVKIWDEAKLNLSGIKDCHSILVEIPS